MVLIKDGKGFDPVSGAALPVPDTAEDVINTNQMRSALGGALAGLSVPTLAALGPVPEKLLKELANGSSTAGLAIGLWPVRLAVAACAPGMLALGAAFPLRVHLLAPAAGRVGRSVGGAAAALRRGVDRGPL